VNLEAIALIFSKFSEELIAAQLALLCLVSASALYYLLIRKKKKESAEWVPAAIVRAYLDRVQAEEREVRMKLFGELSPTYSVTPSAVTAPLAAALGTTVMDPNLLRELEALRAQLSLSDQRAIEFDRNMNAIKAEKAALEQRLKELSAGAPGAAAGPGTPEFVALQKEAQDLKEKLQEYSVIEDDLANLKKFQKENEQLRQRIGQLEAGGTATTVVSGTPAAPEAKTVVSGSETKNQAGVVLVSGGPSAPAAAPAVAAAAPVAAPAPAATPAAAPVAAAAPAGPEVNTNVLQSVTPAVDAGVAAAPAAEKSSKQKEEELLSEFEKMLAS
jgi:hypothetical protein